MMDNGFDKNVGARSKQRAKRRKTNLILNSLIVIVITLIAFVAFTIFSSGDKEKGDVATRDAETNISDPSGDENQAASTEGKQTNGENEQSTISTDDQEETDSTDVEETMIVEEGTNPNVNKTIIDPAWKPIGTEQTGEHETVFNKDSIDWQEMEQAMAHAAGIPRDNMTTWYISNGGPNKAIGTVSPKDGEQAFRVYIEWVDGQGWKPTKVEELIENDKGKSSIE